MLWGHSIIQIFFDEVTCTVRYLLIFLLKFSLECRLSALYIFHFTPFLFYLFCFSCGVLHEFLRVGLGLSNKVPAGLSPHSVNDFNVVTFLMNSRRLQNIFLCIVFTCKTGPKQQNTGERIPTEAPPQWLSASWGRHFLHIWDCRFDLWPPLIQGDRLHWMQPFKYKKINEMKIKKAHKRV